tara:strand:+ start:661 stop:3150 length:2490 start_codon:yes stop_codon:yes gene_type:complete
MASWKKIITSGSISELKTVSASDGFSGSIEQANQPNITSLGTLTSLNVSAGANIDGGNIDATIIGATTQAAGTFTTLSGSSFVISKQGTIGTTQDTDLLTLDDATITVAGDTTLKVDTITESDTNAGVTIETVEFKDGNISSSNATFTIGNTSKKNQLTLSANESSSFSGNVVADSFTGDGSQLTNIVTSLQITGSDNSNGTLNLKTSGLLIDGGTDVTSSVSDADDKITISLNPNLLGVNSLKSDTLEVGRQGTSDLIDFNSGDIVTKIGGSEKFGVTSAGADVTGKLTATTNVEATANVIAGGYVSGSSVTASGHLASQGGATILGTSFSDGGNDIGLFVQNEISASTLRTNVLEITSSVLVTSESTEFGNDITDTHIFSGSLDVTGSGHTFFDVPAVSSSGVFSGSFAGDGTNLDLSSNSTIGSEIFKTIAVAGQDSLVAETNADTLNIASASDGLLITTTEGTDTITFDLKDIPNSSLANSTIAGKALGTSLSKLSNATNGGLTFSDANGYSGSTDVTLALNLNDLTGATVDVAADSIAIIDANDSNATRKESVADLVSGIAGTGLGASSGQLSVTYGTSAGNAAQGNTTLTLSGTSNAITVSDESAQAIGSNMAATIDLADVIDGQRRFTGDVTASGDIYLEKDIKGDNENKNIWTNNTNNITIGGANGTVTTGGDLVVTGDFQVLKDTVTLNAQDLAIEDNIILIGSGSNVNTAEIDTGIVFERTGGSNHSQSAFFFDESLGRFSVGNTNNAGILEGDSINDGAGGIINTGAALVVTAVTASGLPSSDPTETTGTPGQFGKNANAAVGQISIDTDTGEIFIFS